MNLEKYFKTVGPVGVKALAGKAKINHVYLYQMRSGWRRPSPAMARKLAVASGGVLTLHGLRPDVWRKGDT